VLDHGVLVGTAPLDSRLATATRDDYAAAAAAVLVGDGHENTVHELAGDDAWSLDEYAAEVSRQTGRDIAYRPVPTAEYRQILLGGGLPGEMIDAFVETEDAIERGDLATTTGDLRRLTGRPTTPLAATIRAELNSHRQRS
jgi:NAD(P)H dehydrogenase (quinone)